MMRMLIKVATLALLMTGVASAQTTGTITGVVTDGASGKPVVGAVVVATSPAAPGEQTAVTDAKGAFTIANLPAGQYKLQATLEGFKPETRADLALGENVTLRANLAIVPEAVQLEEVVVTGSRIRRKDLTTAAPVSVVNKEQIAASGQVSIGDFLQTIPEQSGGLGRGNNNGGDGTVQIALRGLGAQRTLVLVNGRRWVPGGAGANDSVDLNTLPASAIERIEVLKDGASAVYGSDAIGGVVNVITRKNFTGSEFTAYSGVSGQGDGNTYDVSGAFGSSNDRGSIFFTANFTQQMEVWAGDRSFSRVAKAADYTATGEALPFTFGSGTIPAGRFTINLNTCAAGSMCETLRNTYFPAGIPNNADGTPGTPNRAFIFDPTNPGTLGGLDYRLYGRTGTIGAGGTAVDDSYNFAPDNYLYTPSKRYNFFASGDYKLNDYAKAYFEGSFMNRYTSQKIASVPLVTSNFEAIYSVASQYNQTGSDLALAQSRLLGLGNRSETQDTDTVRLVTGLNGNVSGWYWDASYTFGRTSGVDTKAGVVRSDLVSNAIGPSQNGICYQNAAPDPANPGQFLYSNPIAGCIPLDLLHGQAPAAQLAGISFTGPNRGYNQTTTWAGNVTGELFSLMADRPAAVAVGAEYRTEQGANIVNPFNAAGMGTDYNSRSTQGGYNVAEVFAELNVPIINNAPGIYDLEATLAARFFDYSTFGSDSTYKVGLRYSPVRDVTVRGTYSTAFRAPSITDLFAGNAESFPSSRDPCATLPAATLPPPAPPGTPNPQYTALVAQCGLAAGNGDTASQLRETLGGNPNLQPETATIFTVGLVLEPRMLEGFTLTLDYYDARVKNTINEIGMGTILNGCYPGADPVTGAALPVNAQFCGLIARNSLGFIGLVTDTNQNVGELLTSGLDISARYALNTGAIGRFNFGFDGTVLLKDDWVRPDGTTVHAKGTYDFQYADPNFKGRASVLWNMKSLSAGLSARYIGGYKECGDIDGASGTANLCRDTPTLFHNVDSFTTFDATVGYTLASSQGKTNIALGVTNLADTAPPENFNAFANSADTAYDYMGRFFYARLSHSF